VAANTPLEWGGLRNCSEGIAERAQRAGSGSRRSVAGTFYSKIVASVAWFPSPWPRELCRVVWITWADGFVKTNSRLMRTALDFSRVRTCFGFMPQRVCLERPRFNFVTDAFISGPMGVRFGPTVLPVRHDEYSGGARDRSIASA